MPDLSLVETDDLIEELKARHAACLVAVVQRGETGERQDTISVAFEGGWATCVGLASHVHYKLLSDLDR